MHNNFVIKKQIENSKNSLLQTDQFFQKIWHIILLVSCHFSKGKNASIFVFNITTKMFSQRNKSISFCELGKKKLQKKSKVYCHQEGKSY